MELSSDIEEDIRRLNNPTYISDKNYEELIEKIFSLFTSINSNIELSSTVDKRLISSILTFIFECIKYDFDETSIRSKFDDLQFTMKTRQDRFINQYNKNLSIIQLYLKQKNKK
ncbi:unnamed protein product [Rotaria sp. Silwood1]|nr:unnamed protein product [Rotaria sp. Silwood1]CAF5125952.1 unnamed protein product [Rotaria sp. Silwood1]